MASTSAASHANGVHVKLPNPTLLRELPPAKTYDLRQLSDERSKKIDSLLKKGHVTVAPLREPALILHSHLPHMIGSAYRLGADSKKMQDCYDQIITGLKKIDETFVRGEKLQEDNWREHLQQKDYTVAYVDFFDEAFAKHGPNWDETLKQYMYSGPEPIINGMIGGLGHPFIHLAYAYEFNSLAVASEAMSLGCTEYVPCHSLLDQPIPDNSTYKTQSLADILKQIKSDTRFDGIIEYPGTVNFGLILGPRFSAFSEYWNAWDVTDELREFEHCCDLAVLLAISTAYPEGKFDFFYAHILTVAHAIRVLWHHFPAEFRKSILRQFAIFTICIYILQFRLSFDYETIAAIPVQGRDWGWVQKTALEHRWALDEHFFKVVSAMQEMAVTYGEKDGFYLKAAIKFLTSFNGWEGFGQGVMGFLPSRDGYIPA